MPGLSTRGLIFVEKLSLNVSIRDAPSQFGSSRDNECSEMQRLRGGRVQVLLRRQARCKENAFG